MPDKEANTPPKTTAKDTVVDTAKAVADTTPPQKVDDGTTSKGNGAGPGPSSAAVSVDNQTPAKPRSVSRKIVPVLVLALAGLILFGIIGGWNGWVGATGWQKTDDAILRADITPLSTRVSGTVAQVAVADYQRVKAGDLLVQLKDDDFRAQVAQAEGRRVSSASGIGEQRQAERTAELPDLSSAGWTSSSQRGDQSNRSRN